MYTEQNRSFQEQSSQIELEVLSYQSELSQISRQEQSYNLESVIKQTEQTQEKTRLLEQQIEQFGDSISSPDKTIGMLNDLLSVHENVQLQSMKNKAPIEAEFISNIIGQDLFQHTLILELQATYEGLTSFLKKFEQLQPLVPLNHLDIRTEQYPLLTVTLTYHLFSSQKEIIRV